MAKRPRRQSRPERWREACAEAREIKAEIEVLVERLGEGPLQALRDLRDEYEEWQGALPDNLQNSPLGYKLAEVVGLDFDAEVDLSALDVIDDADNLDLPRGFGKD